MRGAARLKSLLCRILVVVMIVGTILPGLGVGPAFADDIHTVTYDGNGHDGGSVPVDPAGYEPGDPVLVRDNSNGLTKAGFVFGGWNTAADGSGTDYLPGQTFAMDAQDVTLYAKWIDPLASWTDRTTAGREFNDVIYGDGAFYAVGNAGVIAASIDGTIWTKQASATAEDLYDIAVGDGKLVAVGANGTILVSADGENWSHRPSGTTSTLRGIAYGNDLFVAAGDGGTIVVSGNGYFWTPVASGTTGIVNAVTYTNGTFVAVGKSESFTGMVLTSPDGRNWTAKNVGNNELFGVAAGGGKIVAVGVLGAVVISEDGEQWNVRQNVIATDLLDIAYGNGMFIATGAFFQEINYSTDAITWTGTYTVFATRQGVAYGNGLFVAVGHTGIATSANGTSWTAYQHPNLYGMAYGNGQYVAVGANGGIYTSVSGAKWKKQTSNTSNALRAVAFGGGMFVAVGDAGTIVTSSNGADWTVRTSPTSNRLSGIAYGGGRFVAAGASGTVVHSVNGAVWTLADTGFPDLDVHAVAYGSGQFAAVGPSGADGMTYTSADGAAWDGIAVSGVNLFGIAGSGALFVAAGLAKDESVTQNVYASGDGVVWDRRDSGTPQQINGAAYDSGIYVLAGNGGVVSVSEDGINFASVATGIPNALQAVAGGNGTFVAAGLSGAIAQSRTAAPANYVIHFDENGGGAMANPAAMMVLPGDAVGALPAPPSRTGYTFAGWNTKADGTGAAVDESYVAAADAVVYAQWVTLPPAPSNLAAAARLGEVELSWDAAAGAASYAVYLYEGEEAPADPGDWTLVQDGITTTSYTVTDLTNGQTYAFAVTAVNAAGTSDYAQAAVATPGGKGTADDPIIITTPERLDEVRQDLDAWYVLESDIDLSGFGDWTPIGRFTPFTGHFDGKGHTISGLRIRSDLISNEGLFGVIGSGGKVQNLVLSDVDIETANSFASTGALAGMLEGEAANILVAGGTVKGKSYVGGLVGQTSGGAVITASCASARVEGSELSAGGLVGFLADAAVTASCATGEVIGNSNVGGLAGTVDNSEIADSYATGSVSGNSNVGGLIGMVFFDLEHFAATSTVERVHAAGKVENPNDSVGGLIGANAIPVNLISAYYDKDTTGQSDENASSGTPLTREQMGLEASFEDWDFDTLWHLDARIGSPSFLRDDDAAPEMYSAIVTNDAPDKVVVRFAEAIEADDAALERFTVTVNGSAATVAGKQLDGKTLILTLGQPVLHSQTVEVAYADGEPAIVDKTELRMTSHTIEADNETEPLIGIVSFAPADNATGVARNPQLVLTFSDTVEAMSGKYIHLMDEAGALIEKIEASSAQVQVADEVATVSLASELMPLTGYYVLIDAGAFRHSEYDVHGGIADPAAWNFMTEPDPEAEWDVVGQSFTEGKAGSPVLRIGGDGTLYVLFADKAHGGKATVMKRARIDAEWSTVGSAGFSPGAIGAPSLLADGDALYAAFGVVDSNHQAAVHVMKYELGGDEGAWTPAGDPIPVGAVNPDLLADQDSYPFLLMHNDAVHLAYRNGTVTGAMTVKKLGAGGNWETVGQADFSEGEIYDPSLAVLDGELYAGFTDYTFSAGYGATVMKFDETNGIWEPVGERGFTADVAFDTTLVSDGKRLYVVYEADGNGAHKASVMVYDADQGEWVSGGGHFSAGQAFGMDAAGENGGLYAAFRDAGRGNRLVVKKYAGSEWAAVGTATITSGSASDPSLIVHDGILYAAFADASGKLSVLKYSPYNRPPMALKPEVDGKLRMWQTVSGKYHFFDEEYDEEGESLYQWYLADDEHGANRQAVAGATGTAFDLTDEHLGKYLIFEVTPVAAEGVPQGGTAASAPAGPVDYPEPPAAPDVTADDVLNVMVGADATMEYSTDDGNTYTPYDPADPPVFDGDVTVKVRVAAVPATYTPAGEDTTLTFTTNHSTISPTTAGFDKYTESAGYADVTTTMDLNGNTLVSIANGGKPLAVGTDYTVSGNTVTIKKEYLAELAVGTTALTFTFNRGDEQTLTITVTDSTPTDAPVLQTAEAGNTRVTLTWSPAIASAAYKVYVREASDAYGTAIDTVDGTVNSYTVTGLTNGTAYYFVVTAVRPAGESEASNELSAVPHTVPSAPTNVTAYAGNGRATVEFEAPEDNGGSEITGYEVTVSPGDRVVTGTASPIVVTGLTNGTSYTFTVRAVNRAGSGEPSEPSNAVVPRAPSRGNHEPETPEDSAAVLINGREEKVGTAVTETRNGQTVTTISIDPDRLDEKLAEAGLHAVVTIPAPPGTDVVIGELNGRMVKNMEDRQAVLEIRTDRAAYTLPARQINIDAISAQLGASAALEDIKIRIEVGEPTAETAGLAASAAADGSFAIVVPPVVFTVTAAYGDAVIEVTKFGAYVERTIAIPDGVDPERITTGVVLDPDGTARHVPTKIIVVGGSYYAVINSLTNSAYTVVWHPVEFRDMAGHWAKDAANDMGSRMILEGTGGGRFSPDREITRAEFAAIIVRALGLAPEQGANVFPDVKESDWHNGAVRAAHAYGLLSGYADGTFRPNEKITREQAMVILAKAMALTGLKASLPEQSPDDALRAFADAGQASGWAVAGIADCVQAGIVTGKNGRALAPQDTITRAEAAAMMERLLRKSDLI